MNLTPFSYDGDSLRFPDFVGRKAIAQARRQASWLSSCLKQATGQVVPVIPALALPGWWIEGPRPTSDADVRVFNPAGRGANFMAEARLNRTLDEGAGGSSDTGAGHAVSGRGSRPKEMNLTPFLVFPRRSLNDAVARACN